MNNFTQEYVRIRDIEQFFVIYPKDSKKLVLHLHGGPGESEAPFLYRLIPEERDYIFVTYDQRGTGRTQDRNKSKPEDVTFETLLEDLHETVRYLIKRFNPDTFVLYGHSWGTVLGCEYVHRHPLMVDCLVCEGQVVNISTEERTAYEHLKEIISEKDRPKLDSLKDFDFCFSKPENLKKLMLFRKLENKYGMAGISKDGPSPFSIMIKSPLFRLKDLFMSMNSVMKTNGNLLKAVDCYDVRNHTEYLIPYFLVCGKSDWQTPYVCAEEYYNTVSAPKKHIYWQEGGHSSSADHPEQFKKTIEDIFNRL